MLQINKLQNPLEVVPPNSVPPQINPNSTFSVVAGPNRQEMNFPSMLDQKPDPTEFEVDLPCGKLRLALALLADYSYSRMNTQVIQVNGKVVGISDDGNKLLPEHQELWAEALREYPIRMAYDIVQHTGQLFFQTASA